MFSRILQLFILFIFTFPTWADQLIIEPDMGRKPILDALAGAQHSVELVMYGMTDQPLLNAILQQQARGKNVKVILEQSPYKTESENSNSITALNTNHVPWLGSIPPLRLIHQKTLIIDGHQAIVMTFNFTQATFKKERNFALIIDDPNRVRAIDDIFIADWNHKPIINSSSDILVSPDDSREKLLLLINHAQLSIRIYAQNINDYRVVGALAKAARNGVNVQIITSQNLSAKQADYLKRAGVSVHNNHQFMIHAKVFIIDDQQAVIGSINLTRASFDNNRELAVVTRDKHVIEQLNATFMADWGDKKAFNPKKLANIHYNRQEIKQAVRLLKKFARGYLESLNKDKSEHE
jgi:cardiolipin synthase